MKEFSFKTRQKNIETLKTKKLDVFIIGGGITGAGVARDASRRGLSVGLIDMSDFSSGTSSRSSKLVHGGLRYLENLEFGLVFEALSERAKLFKMAPHLVHPLRFLLPLYRGQRVGMFKMGLGMWLYDILSLFDTPEMHKRHSSKSAIEAVKSLKANGLAGAYEYSDAYMDDDRLVHETLRSANESGAASASYIKAIGATYHDCGKIKSVKCKDLVSNEEFFVEANSFVSCVGPWTDELGSEVVNSWKSRMRPSKGIHLTFKKERFPLKKAVVMPADNDKRIIFAIPRHEMVIVGTTDTDYQGDLSEVTSLEEDVQYVLNIISDYFPTVEIKKEDIVASYAGVRPLVKDGAASESSTSRDHVIWSELKNLTFVAGGKYTTYRNMAEEAVDHMLETWPIEKRLELSSPNTEEPLNPNATDRVFKEQEQIIAELLPKTLLSQNQVQFLIERHGREAVEIIKLENSNDKVGEGLLWRLEARWAQKTTMCFSVRDFYLRRTPLFLSETDHGLRFLEAIVEEFSAALGWTPGQQQAEVASFKKHRDAELGWKS